MLANQVQWYIKVRIHCDQVGLISGLQSGLTLKSLSVIYQINKLKKWSSL